jgi:hypothetical protein
MNGCSFECNTFLPIGWILPLDIHKTFLKSGKLLLAAFHKNSVVLAEHLLNYVDLSNQIISALSVTLSFYRAILIYN